MPEANLTFEVTDQDTAAALGSGDVAVLATPRLLAWCEAATCVAVESLIEDRADRTSVGTRVALDHLAATPVGDRVHVHAVVAGTDGRRVDLIVSATDDAGRLLATGEVRRAIVARDRFPS